MADDEPAEDVSPKAIGSAVKVDPPVAGIGASAGGIKALQSFFAALPERTGIAYVVIVHLAPEHNSELPQILATRTSMPVVQVGDAMPLQADHVYVTPPDRRLEIGDHHIAARPFEQPRGQRAPIDLFFRSLAEQRGDGFAIVLTGAGSDGTVGLKAIKEAGGIILVQDPGEAEYGSMPRSAIATGLADFVLPIADMGRTLLELSRSKRQTAHSPQPDAQVHVQQILGHVRARTGHDFSHYKKSTIMRRIARRAHVNKKEGLQDYCTFLKENVEEVQALFADLLISVTTFFRDPKAFEVLAEKVVPQLFASRTLDDAIRVWVPGCATGEEAYSIAMLLLEEAAKHDIRPELQIFATDLDLGGLAVAREGLYPPAIESDVGEERLLRFFSRDGDHYRVKRELRESLLFATHSLLRDPPFGRLDLVSCRNLLIYLDRDVQQQTCTLFHYALKRNGHLFLGPSESADNPPNLFRAIDREARIYQSIGRPSEAARVLPPLIGHVGRGDRAPSAGDAERVGGGGMGELSWHRQALERTAPPSVLVDAQHRVRHLSETAGRYLQPSAGPLSNDIAELVRREMRFDLRLALNRVFEKGESTLSLPIAVQFNGTPQLVYLQVRPVRDDEDVPPRQAVVFFIEAGPVRERIEVAPAESIGEEPSAADVTRKLREELVLTQNQLKTTRDESEGATEELRAANEELQSINEEYRSTAEELETSKEELQSVNEELQTVNAELKTKLESVTIAHSDLQNLMAATDVGVLFLDPNLRIKRFTPRITELFNITAADEGRPITDFSHRLAYEALVADASKVLQDLALIEHEVRSLSGSWYLMRLRPYRTVDDRIDGVVVTFVDMTRRRQAEDALRESEERLRQMIQLVEMSSEPICIWDFDDGVVEWNRGSEILFGHPRDQMIGREKHAVLSTTLPDGGTFGDVKREVLGSGSWSGELVHRTKDGRKLTVEARVELFPVHGRRLVLETNRDVTERKSWERHQQLLLNELTHRVRNILSVVKSMSYQTMRNSGSLEDFVSRFDGRIDALANTHKLLVDSNWRGAELEVLARSQLATYVMDQPDRLRLDGPAVVLPAHRAGPLGLVLHELATNAAKYGAWSGSSGAVALSWQMQGDDGGRHASIVWRERDGPTVAPPARLGFGSSLIRRSLPGAKIFHEFAPSGVVCKITLPLEDADEDD